MTNNTGVRYYTNPKLHPEIKAGNYSLCVVWDEEPISTEGNFRSNWLKRKAERLTRDDIPSMDGYGFRSTDSYGTVFDFTYAREEEVLEGMLEWYGSILAKHAA